MTVFERDEAGGGLVRFGVPDFKIEKWIVERRLEQLAAEGVVFRYGVDVGVDLDAGELREQFDAVVVATGSRGAPRPAGSRPRAPGRALRDGVPLPAQPLRRPRARTAARGAPPAPAEAISAAGKHVIVIGGGDTGADCVGNAHREQAKSVTQIELVGEPPPSRPDDVTPWPRWPMKLRTSYALKEGGERDFAISTTQLTGRNGRVEQIHWAQNTGVPPFEPVPGTEEARPAELVLLAMGFLSPEPLVLDQLGVARDARGNADAQGVRHLHRGRVRSRRRAPRPVSDRLGDLGRRGGGGGGWVFAGRKGSSLGSSSEHLARHHRRYRCAHRRSNGACDRDRGGTGALRDDRRRDRHPRPRSRLHGDGARSPQPALDRAAERPHFALHGRCEDATASGILVESTADGAQILGPGAIRGFPTGITVDGATRLQLHDFAVSESCGRGISVARADNLEARNLIMRKNGTIAADRGSALDVEDAASLTLADSSVFLNGAGARGAAIDLHGCNECRLTGNRVLANHGAGVRLDTESHACEVQRNVILDHERADVIDQGSDNALALNAFERAAGTRPPTLWPLLGPSSAAPASVIGCATIHAPIGHDETITLTCPQDPGLRGLRNSVVGYRLLNPFSPGLPATLACNPGEVITATSGGGGALRCRNSDPIWPAILEVTCCLN